MLQEILKLYRDGNISTIKLSRMLSTNTTLQTELNLYCDLSIPMMGKFYMYLNDINEKSVNCGEGVPKRFLSLSKGFMNYCGNQSTCVCNKLNADTKRKSKSHDEKLNIIKKRKATNNIVYGCDFASQTSTTKRKAAKTCIDRYGSVSPMMNVDIQHKSQHTCYENHGVSFPQQNKNIYDKTCDVFEDRYGSPRPAQNSEISKKTTITLKSSIYNDVIQIRDNATPLFDMNEYATAQADASFNWQCKQCDHIFSQPILPGLNARCYICHPKTESVGEYKIRQYLNKQKIKYIHQDRTIIGPSELDFYCPDQKVAIEYNGLYWHSEVVNQDRSYHLSKHKKCMQLGITLLHVFEHELEHKSDIVFSRIGSALSKSQISIGARKTTISIIDNKIASEFLNNNHLQGSANAKYSLGLMHNNELVSVMTFVRTRYSKKYEYEMLRFASKNGYNVQGAGSKLFKFACNTYDFKSVVSYANLSWGEGDFYSNLGFVKSHSSKPNYWYFKGLNVESRIKYQKHKLPQELHYLGSEWEIMKFLKFNRFWDCGNNVWIWEK